MADTDHWTSTPRLAANAIVTELTTRLKFLSGGAGAGGSGCVRSIARVASDTDLDVIRRALNPGLPGLLVYYGGGDLAAGATHQQAFKHPMTFRVLCCAGTFEDLPGRLSGDGEMDSAAATVPGVEELQDFALRFAARALESVSGIKKAHPVKLLPSTFVEVGLYIGAVDLVATREVDMYDDSTLVTLEDIGIVRDPSDYDDLFTGVADDVPNSDLPVGLDGGVGDLDD